MCSLLRSNRRVFSLMGLFLLLLVVIFTFPLGNRNKVSRCYSERKGGPIIYFPDVMDHEQQPKPGKSIFFLETSCSDSGVAKLNPRQACAIESAALQNPNRDIFLLFVSPVGINTNQTMPQYFDILLKYPNIQVRTLDLWKFAYGTPIFEWLDSNALFESKFVYEHLSDILRAVVLLKYGGFYVDLDVVVQKSFDNLEEDFIGDDWSEVVAGGVMHLNNHGIGSYVIQRYLKKVIKGYDGKVFNSAGPVVLTKVLAELCSTQHRALWTRAQCSGLKLQSKKTFYPISWGDYYRYMDPNQVHKVLKLARNSILIHVWNDMSKSVWHKIGTKNAYQVIASRNCPNVYANSTYF